MRRIAIINQKGGVGKTTTTANLGAALAIQGRRVVLVDMDAQANLSMALGIEAPSGEPTSYAVLMGEKDFASCVRRTKIPNLSLVPSNIDLSGAELELASAMGREFLLRDAIVEWNAAHAKKHGKPAADYVLFDCPPSLGLLSINALAAAGEVLITLQTEFLALQGMSKLFEVISILKKRLNPDLVVTGIVPSLYDSRLKLAREVLGEIRTYFKGHVVPHPIRANVKLAEAPSFGATIFEYAPDSNGADDYMKLAAEIVAGEERDPDLAGLAAFDPAARLPAELTLEPASPKRVPPPPPKRKSVPVPAAPERKPAAEHDASPKAEPVKVEARKLASPALPSARAAAPKAAPPAPARSVAPRGAPVNRAGPKAETVAPKAAPAAPKSVHEAAPVRPAVVVPPPVAAKARKTREKAPAPVQEVRAKAPRGVRAPKQASHVARADDIPPLPPDAFEILSSPIDT